MRKFLKNRRGSILIEAAIAFPVLIVLLLGMVEFGQAYTLKRRNAQVASTAADLVAQVSCVTAAGLQDVSKIAAAIVAPYSYSASIAGLRITSIMQNASNATVQSSYALGTMGAASQGGAYALPAGLASQNQAVIVVEASYNFTPAIGNFLTSAVTFTAKAYNKPRLSTFVALQPSCPARWIRRPLAAGRRRGGGMCGTGVPRRGLRVAAVRQFSLRWGLFRKADECNFDLEVI